MQHYLSWTVGLVIAQANDILMSRLSPLQTFASTAAHLWYGVDSPCAIDLLVRDVKSQTLARSLGRIARDRELPVLLYIFSGGHELECHLRRVWIVGGKHVLVRRGDVPTNRVTGEAVDPSLALLEVDRARSARSAQ